MKQKWVIRLLSLALAGIMFVSDPAPVLAANLESTELEIEETTEDQPDETEEGKDVDKSNEEQGALGNKEIAEGVSVEEKMLLNEIQPTENDEPDEEAFNETIPVTVTSVKLEPSSITMALNDSVLLTATAFEGESVVDSSFSWVSSDAQIASINSSGTVIANSPGTAVITVEAGGKTASCEVKVIIPVASVDLDKTEVILKKNQNLTLLATVYPENTTEDKMLSWGSSDENVVSVDENGKLTALKAGNVDITVNLESNEELSAVCHVTVLEEEYKTGWQWIGGKWYYYDLNGDKQTGWQCVNGKYYYMDTNGIMKTGWLYDGGKWYYLNASGERRSGWLTLNNKKYYLAEDGVMQIGLVAIGQNTYYFNSSGEMQTGWRLISDKWYYLNSSGIMLTGWNAISNKRYYFNSRGEMQTGWQLISGKWYYLNSSGEMQTDWQLISGKWYYLNSSGVMLTGWQKLNNQWYYLDSSGAMQTGFYKVGSYTYYFNTSGVMLTGWQKIEGKWYFADSNSGLQYGWKKLGGKWYYFNSKGEMQIGWLKLNNQWYYLNSSGAMQTGWIKVNGKSYYLNQNGVMQTGWQPIGGTWYYFNSDGSMKTGWLQSGSNWYYLKSNGAMATSDTVIDGKVNKFDSNGIWQGVAKTGQIQAYGIDVSSNQGSINWEKVADDDIDFAMLRVVVGKGSNMERDSRFKEYYDGARDAGIKVGAYRYSYATSRTKARNEADAVIKALNGRKLDYPIVLDVEDDSILSGTESNSRRSEIILAFKEKVEAAGYKFALYANVTWLNKYLDMSMLKDVDIWVARWRALDQGHGYTGNGNVIMWQYSSTGKVNGISGNVDLNVSYKKY